MQEEEAQLPPPVRFDRGLPVRFFSTPAADGGMELEPSGERVIADQARSSPEAYAVYLMHEATYRFAQTYTRGLRVLDFGCGSGYGSAQIAETAAHVVGVDIVDDAVAYAREHFQRDNLAFRRIDPDAPLRSPTGASTRCCRSR
jgi:SAM-dependent methyltransferase